MAGRVLRRVSVVEVRHLLVPVLGQRTAQVRPWNEWVIAVHVDLSLEGVSQVGILLVRGAVVYEEDRDRARALGDVLREVLRGNVPLDDVELEAVRTGDVVYRRIAGLLERHRYPCLPRPTLPNG